MFLKNSFFLYQSKKLRFFSVRESTLIIVSTNTQSLINYLTYVTRELNRYIPLVFLILGTVGNITNIMVFTRPLLRKNPFSIYFVSCSITNLFAVYIGLITPFLGVYNLDPTQTIDSLCKIRFYLRYSTITLSTWFIVLACVDRYISTSTNVNLRLWSSIHIAKRIVYFASLICFLIPYTQVFYCYAVNSKNVCTYKNNICNLLNNIILLLCNSGLPPMLMVIISILTIQNVKKRNIATNHRRKDGQLIKILFIQVFIFVLFAVPVAVQKLYASSTMFMTKSSLTTAIESLVKQISIEISYISNSTTFYVYSLTSKKYRKEVIQILSMIFKCCHRNNLNRVQPMDESRLNGNSTMTRNVNNLYKSNT